MEKHLLSQLYQTYGREIYLYLFSLCKNSELAEDLMQETFVKALLSLSDSHKNMRAWLYLVARNSYFNEQKRQKRQLINEESVVQRMAQNTQKQQEDDILETVIEQEEKRALYQAMLQLSDRKREVLQLQYFGGFTLKQAAEFLKIAPENARVLSHRAKAELREMLRRDDTV